MPQNQSRWNKLCRTCVRNLSPLKTPTRETKKCKAYTMKALKSYFLAIIIIPFLSILRKILFTCCFGGTTLISKWVQYVYLYIIYIYIYHDTSRYKENEYLQLAQSGHIRSKKGMPQQSTNGIQSNYIHAYVFYYSGSPESNNLL